MTVRVISSRPLLRIDHKADPHSILLLVPHLLPLYYFLLKPAICSIICHPLHRATFVKNIRNR
jgi:hypothetical protein